MRQKHHKEDEETALLQCSACKYTFSTSNRILAGYPTTNVRSAASKGLGLLLYGTQAATNGETVGAAWPLLLHVETEYSWRLTRLTNSFHTKI